MQGVSDRSCRKGSGLRGGPARPNQGGGLGRWVAHYPEAESPPSRREGTTPRHPLSAQALFLTHASAPWSGRIPAHSCRGKCWGEEMSGSSWLRSRSANLPGSWSLSSLRHSILLSLHQVASLCLQKTGTGSKSCTPDAKISGSRGSCTGPKLPASPCRGRERERLLQENSLGVPRHQMEGPEKKGKLSAVSPSPSAL